MSSLFGGRGCWRLRLCPKGHGRQNGVRSAESHRKFGVPASDFSYPSRRLPAAGGVVTRRAAIGAERIWSRSISGIGRSSMPSDGIGQRVVVAKAAAQPTAANSACRRWHAPRKPIHGRRAPRRHGPRPSARGRRAAMRCSRRRQTILQPFSYFGRGEIAVAGRDDQRGARHNPQDLGHSRAGPHQLDAARRQMGMARKAIAGRGEFGVAFGCGQSELRTVCTVATRSIR